MTDYNYFDDKDGDDNNELFGKGITSDDAKDGLDGIKKTIGALLQDKLMPKSVITKLSSVREILGNDKEELQLRINKVQDILNEITDDSNLPAFIKTSVWNLAGMLETL
ncbi:MAG: UPF0147 family protein [Candidatus Woesearchaeota archaeon]|jgi:uncharacterized protein (UPF0147 family)